MTDEHAVLDVVVLAAGRGSRLASFGDDRPKWLLEVGERTIANRHLQAFELFRQQRPDSLRRVLAVTGYQAERVEQEVGSDAEFVFNDDYLTRNNWYSLLLGLRALPDEASRVVVLNGDLCAEPSWLAAFLVAAASTDAEGLIAIDFARSLTDESMKVAAQGDQLHLIGKHEFPGAVGEYVGMLMACGAVKDQLGAELERFESDPAATNEWYEGAVARVAAAGGRWVLWPTPSSDWVEIDDEADLARAAELGVG